ALREAQEYRRTWEDYEKQKAAGVAPLNPPRRDLAMEPLVEVLKGERAVHVHTEHEVRGIVMLMRLAEEFGFRIKTNQHGWSAYMAIPEMKRHGTSVSMFGTFGNETMYQAAMLIRAGVLVSVNSDGEGAARHLNQDAAALMKYGGLTEDEALAMLTINPAKQLDIDKRVGSIEVGKDADLAIWDHHPLSVYAVADTVLIDGLPYFTRERDKARRAWVEAERKRLSGGGGARTTAPADQPAGPAADEPRTEVNHVR
ncbi:MAG: amidohydrolase family protein, partial [Acidobacteria bacterium]|nr:amidohydrolase family protein [Acidobacteriota bacterium]